jgi:hypothetical protein
VILNSNWSLFIYLFGSLYSHLVCSLLACLLARLLAALLGLGIGVTGVQRLTLAGGLAIRHITYRDMPLAGVPGSLSATYDASHRMAKTNGQHISSSSDDE